MLGARFLLAAFAAAGIASGFHGCASAPKVGEFSAAELFRAACPEIDGKVVSGSFWTKLRSPELNGQFPASMRVDFPSRLVVEVTNLIGAPQAWLRIENGKTELRLSAQNEKRIGQTTQAQTMLGGLPLEHAPRLFAGGVPCPGPAAHVETQSEIDSEGGLIVQARDRRSNTSTQYAYRFDRYLGLPWVREVRFEGVTITREEPASPDGAPKRWSASSSRGEIQVRWKDRSVVSSPSRKL